MKLALALVVLMLQAQQPVFRANVNFVELDVSVLDKNRRPVLGLAAADFTVLEDGVPQKVETFAAVVLPEPEPPPTAWWTSVPADVERNTDVGDGVLFTTVISVADASLIPRVKEIGRRLVQRMGPRDRMAIAYTGFSGNSQDFTSDTALLLRAVDRFMSLSMPSTTCTLVQTLIAITKLMEPQRGRRKTMFLVGESLPGLDNPNNPCFHALLELFEVAQRAHVNIYPINPRGLTGFADVEIESADAMNQSISVLRDQVAAERTLAENTGGIAISQTNLFDENIERAYVENRAYYVIGYHSTNASTDRNLRQLKVTVARDGVTVRSRTGYSVGRPRAAGAAEAPASLPEELADAGRAAIPATALRLDATALSFRTPKGATVAVIASAQPRLDAGASVKEEVQARAMLIDRFGDIKQTAERRVGGFVSAGGERSELRVPMILPAERPGRYQVRVAANSVASNATGSVFVNIDVPDFKRERLSMSGVALRAAPDSPGMTLPGLADVFPFLPSTRRAFRSTDSVEAAVRVYANRPEEPASVVCRIKDAAEAVVSVLERAAAAGETSSASGALVRCPVPVVRLGAGYYLLEIEARAGTRTAARALKFVVE